MRLDFYWCNYKYLPYERLLAIRELTALMGKKPVLKLDNVSLEGPEDWENQANRLTYFRETVAANGSRVIPLQAVLESSANGKSQRKQYTRYSAHGLHDYRGKFNPQVVRAIGNLFNLQPGAWILDPFCGSGTTMLEAAHCGWNAVGIDLNPLGILIAKAKIAAIRVPLEKLQIQSNCMIRRLSKRVSNISFDTTFSEQEMKNIGGNEWEAFLPSCDYLKSWFKDSVLVQISLILDEISKISSPEVRLVLRVVLSDILRQMSLQDPGDLRMRRLKSPPENCPAVEIYLDAVRKKLETITKARQYLNDCETVQDALAGDARSCSSIIREHPRFGAVNYFDAVITSPPYATALPYIDTQRLSLVLLGLIESDQIHKVEKSLIGNREINTKERLKLEEAIEANASELPEESVSLCQRMKESFDIKTDGFRKLNVPTLLYKYFSEMKMMFSDVALLLKTEAPFAIIIGRSSTCLGGIRFIIDTPHFLSILAENSGFRLQEAIELNTYQRYDVHQVNSIRSETLLILRKR